MLALSSRALVLTIAAAAAHVGGARHHTGRPSRGMMQRKDSYYSIYEEDDSSEASCSGAGTRARGAGDATAAASAAAARGSLFRAALARLQHVRDEATGKLTTDGFVDVCELTLPIIESFGPAFSMVVRDIRTNIDRLRRRKAADPERFALLFELVDDDVKRGDLGPHSCVKAVLWLKRGMEFMLAIMTRLMELPPSADMHDVVSEQYHATLHRWHGWVASSAFSVALNFVPTRHTFLERLAGGRFSRAAEADLLTYAARFGALLADVHARLDAQGLDDPAKV